MPVRILVAADDGVVGARHQRELFQAGLDARFCDDPDTAVSAACTGGFDVLVVSQTTPNFDVLRLVRQAKLLDAGPKVVILSRFADLHTAMDAMREGAADYLCEPCSNDELCRAVRRISQLSTLHRARGHSHAVPELPSVFEGMIGQCSAIREVFALIERIAPSDSTVLLTGESGTGKEMVARAIHRLSRRQEFPLLACDCTALAPTLLESELFGHVKGSFSGAVASKKGLFEAAHRGTLLLDEVANLSAETQAKLLRLLETRRIRRVGDTEEHEVDIRLIATANRSLAEMVKQGLFRADLYYRLNVVPVLLPALRDRVGDIPLLAQFFLNRFSAQAGAGKTEFAREALDQMEVYSWPGNVRELRNIIERLVVLYGGSCVGLQHLPSEIRAAKATINSEQVPRTWEAFRRLKRQIIDDLECRFLTAALNRCGHSVSQAAESVGMQRSNFHALLRTHGLKSDTGKDH
jgi:DNA-binding NtrC family response regulator